MLKNILTTIIRNFRKNRISSLINLLGLSTGLAASVLMLVWVKNELSYDSYHPGADRIYRITNALEVSKGQVWVWENSPTQLKDEVQKNIPGIEVATRVYSASQYSPQKFYLNNQVFREKNFAYVDEDWFNVFRYDFIHGTAKEFLAQPNNILLTASKARTYFGSLNVVGKTIGIDSSLFTVRAVIADNPSNSSFQFDILIPRTQRLIDPSVRNDELNFNNFNYITFLRLQEKTSVSKVEKGIDKIMADHGKDNISASLLPVSEMHFDNSLQHSILDHGSKNIVYIFSILAAFLLVIACINYVNLSTAQASLRLKEVSIKKINGARRSQLFGQFILESLFLSLVAMITALLIISLVVPYYNDITGKNFFVIAILQQYWLLMAGVVLATVLLTGIYPAILLSSFNPISIFKGKNILNVRDSLLRKILVVFQFTVSIILIIGTIVIYKQLKFIREKDAGYDRSYVYTVNLPIINWYKYGLEEGRKQIGLMQERFMQALQQQPSISQISKASTPIVNYSTSTSGALDWKGREPDYNPTIAPLVADAGLKDLLALQMKAGRWFQDGNHEKGNFILNEEAVREFKLEEPVIGSYFRFSGDTGQIIGIMKDVHFKSFHEKIGPMIVYQNPASNQGFYIKTAKGQTADAIAATEKIWKDLFPGEPFEYNFLDEQYEKMYQTEQRTAGITIIFSLIAISISCLGLFGLVTFAAEKRTREIGIRKVLGAGITSLSGLLSKDFLVLVLIATVIAIPAAGWAMHNWLEDFAYRTTIDWWVYALAALITLFIALATISYRTIRSALQNPVKSLRRE